MYRLISLLLLMSLLMACVPSAQEPVQTQALTKEEYIESLRTFAQKSASKLFEDETENYNFSPLSLSIALAMLSQGAEGETLEEILEAKGLSGFDPKSLSDVIKSLSDSLQKSSEEAEVLLANALFSEESFPLDAAFKKGLEEDFDAFAQELSLQDPSDIAKINDFIEERTRGKIEDAYAPAEASADVLLLINTLYAKLPWLTPFEDHLSAPLPFYSPEGEVTPIFMNAQMHAPYMETDDYQAVRLELAQGYSMRFVLPREGLSPAQLLEKQERLFELKEPGESKLLSLSIPTFSFENSFELPDVLRTLGMEKAFTDSAQFPLISSIPTLVSTIQQDTFLEVNEGGIEAAAATIVGMEPTSMPVDEPLPIVFDRPFLFLLESDEGVLLFLGILSNPAK